MYDGMGRDTRLLPGRTDHELGQYLEVARSTMDDAHDAERAESAPQAPQGPQVDEDAGYQNGTASISSEILAAVNAIRKVKVHANGLPIPQRLRDIFFRYIHHFSNATGRLKEGSPLLKCYGYTRLFTSGGGT